MNFMSLVALKWNIGQNITSKKFLRIIPSDSAAGGPSTLFSGSIYASSSEINFYDDIAL